MNENNENFQQNEPSQQISADFPPQNASNQAQEVYNSSIDTKPGNKKIVVAAIVAVIVVLAAGAVFAAMTLFKSDTDVYAAAQNTFSKYFTTDNDTFLSKLTNSKVLKKAFNNSDFNPSITLKGEINEFPDIPDSLKGAGIETTININKQNKEGDLSLKGFYGGFDIKALDAYANSEYAAISTPFLTEKLFLNWNDIPSEYMEVINNFSNAALLEASKNDFSQTSSELDTEFKTLIDESLKFENKGSEEIDGIDTDVYTASLSGEETKTFVKKFYEKLFSNDNFKSFFEDNVLKSNPQFAAVGITDASTFLTQLSTIIDSAEIEGVDISFFIKNNEMVKFEADIKAADSKGFILTALFTGKNELTDKAEFDMYLYDGSKDINNAAAGITFSDIKTKEGSNTKKEQSLKFIENSKSNGINLVTSYDASNSQFNGNIDLISSGTSKNIGQFNGTIENNDNVFNIKFDKISFTNSYNETIDFSLELNVSQSEAINSIDTQNAINVFKEPEKLDEAFQKAFGNLSAMF